MGLKKVFYILVVSMFLISIASFDASSFSETKGFSNEALVTAYYEWLNGPEDSKSFEVPIDIS